ncbi:MAG: hypothetical protein ABTD50_19605 [Polyangiaceae bacterium]
MARSRTMVWTRCGGIWPGVAVAVLECTAACGGASEGAVATVDAAAQDVATASDAASGDSAVDSSETGEASVIAESPEAGSGGDAGAADSGTLQCGDASCDPSQICLYPPCPCVSGGGTCPPPSCLSPAPGAGTFDCSGGDARPSCSAVSSPIPSTCSRVCYGSCA